MVDAFTKKKFRWVLYNFKKSATRQQVADLAQGIEQPGRFVSIYQIINCILYTVLSLNCLLLPNIVVKSWIIFPHNSIPLIFLHQSHPISHKIWVISLSSGRHMYDNKCSRLWGIFLIIIDILMEISILISNFKSDRRENGTCFKTVSQCHSISNS